MIRADFQASLQRQVQTILGRPGSQQRQQMETAFGELLDTESGKVNFDKLPPEATKKLNELQKAAEGFESIFVKGLLSQMRKVSFLEKPDEMRALAEDMLDQNLAEKTAKSGSSIGIAKTVFDHTAPRIIREAAAQRMTDLLKTKTQ